MCCILLVTSIAVYSREVGEDGWLAAILGAVMLKDIPVKC